MEAPMGRGKEGREESTPKGSPQGKLHRKGGTKGLVRLAWTGVRVREQKRPSVEKPAGLRRRVLFWEQEDILGC